MTTPRWVRLLWLVFAAYLVVPVGEVPLFGLSVSAPLFCFLALDLLLRPCDWRPYRPWLLLAALFWMAHLLSLTANVFLGNLTGISEDQGRMLLRFAYWMLVFVATLIVLHKTSLGSAIAAVLGVSAVLLGLLRLVEASLFSHWGGGNPHLLSQNDYGLGFSAFVPFAVWLVLRARGWRKAVARVGCLALLLAVMGNGSRSAWITVALGLLLMLLLWGLTQSRNVLSPAGALLLLAGLPLAALWLAPSALRDPVLDRAATLAKLDRDKPFVARQLLVRKGIQLFLRNPLFGVGVGGFTETIVPLEIRPPLNYRSPEEFNRKTPHNAYVKVLAETGILGAASLLGLLALLAWRGFHSAIARARRGETWAIPVFVAFVCINVHFWTLSGLTGTAPWFLYGMLAAVIERQRSATAASDRLRS